jgi:DNA-binding NtrC family response regulator
MHMPQTASKPDLTASRCCETVLVVEDDDRVRSALAGLLDQCGYRVETAINGTEAWDKIVKTRPAVVLSDLQMPGLTGLELLRRTREFKPGVSFIMLTGYGTIPAAVEATRLGAFHFLEKPADPARLQMVLRNCLQPAEGERRSQIAARKPRDLSALGKLAGISKQMRRIRSLVATVAPSPASVLITGESGTGKEVVARALHDLSPCRNNAFVALNCAAIPESLIESELFGHERGAFTGAVRQHIGCFELAQSGTLLLDEIGEMPLKAQAKLLRVLEDLRVRRLGGKSEIAVAVRVLASTNRVPENAVRAGVLRRDLYYRLNIVHIVMPPLRERLDDLEALAAVLLQELCEKHGRPPKALDPSTLDRLRAYPWPGNVRELRNVLERAVVTCRENGITPDKLPAVFQERHT